MDADTMDASDVYHAQTGKPFVKAGQPYLEDDPDLWQEVWEQAAEMLLAHWIGLHPGSRPPAWWEFEAPDEPHGDDESELTYLDRMGLIEAPELEAILEKALDLVEYDRGRSSKKTPAGFYLYHWIPPDDLHRFAAARGLLSEAEAAILGLDRNGNDL
jgi:hypothetical protein